ncbi:MAG: HD domain-containing protein [Victivallaceae bacterium]|nr:HD domain-containing protein [Victivallaceae bacterium]
MSLSERFDAYAGTFVSGTDAELDRNIELKRAHSFRVTSLADRLAAAEGFRPDLQQTVHFAAMLHDCARFEQFRRFRTFRDADSFNHGLTGAELAGKLGFLDGLAPEQRRAATDAIAFHNARTIPDQLEGDSLICVNAVRDADKLDIIALLIDYHLKHLDDPAVTLGLSTARRLSAPVLNAALNGATPNYGDLKTIYDFAAARIAWFSDLNFSWSRRRYLERRFDKTIFDLLDGVPDSDRLRESFYNAAAPWRQNDTTKDF